MVRSWNGMGLLAVAGLLASCGGGSDGGSPAVCAAVSTTTAKSAAVNLLSGTGAQAESMRQTAGSTASPLQPRPALQVLARAIALGDVAQAKVAAVKPLVAQMGVPQQIGLPRDVAATGTLASTAALLQWQATAAGGQVAAISIQSGQAVGLRLGVLVKSLPASATLRVYAPGAATAYTIPAQDVLDTLARNRAAGDTSDAGRTYWAPVVDGTEATLEIELPALVSPAEVQIAIPRVSHLFSSPVLEAKVGNTAKAAVGSCEVDVACSPSYATESNAVARMNFVSGGAAYLCTGTLVNDATGSGTPYFLGANHCVSTQAAASTLQTWWFYRASTCSGSTPDAAATTRTGGATLLYANATTDTSFMRLADTPPTGAVFAGWSVNAPTLGDAAAGLHHPQGSWQAISSGVISSFLNCTGLMASSLDFSCSVSNQANGNFVNAQFSRGATEEGSSGSPLFETIGSGHYLVGQLYGGSSSCSNPTGSNAYGRFDVAYNAALRQWLAPSSCR
ncbi:trypsin-like peptidase domain-containing protein [Rhodoferax sp.]|uniref:trypsin-like serine peptidase n=1 Tax=Rhodoferax sp. TaxID=50421 RepID=UPI0025D08480|nr:trypsin-like peptidase domain-containing protein [Rhodoferax sp.]